MTTATEKLRAFEDQHLGKDTVRVNGEIERGHGAPIRNLSPDLQRQHATLEKIVAAEKHLGDTASTLAAAQSAHEEAQAALDRLLSAHEPAHQDPAQE